jgi:hypothetical protein
MFKKHVQLGDIQLHLDELSPFLAVVLIRNEHPIQANEQEGMLLGWLEDDLKWFLPENHRTIQRTCIDHNPLRDGEVVYTILYFTELKEASWTKQDEIRDHINQVVIMATWGNFAALHFSDNELKGGFINFILSQDYQGLWPKPIAKNRLNAIFVNGPARTLWLAGIHKRKSIKADSKILMGANIQDTLNPLDDQSYYFTSARCFQRDWGRTSGVSPNKSQIWIRKSQSWADFRKMVNDVLLRLSDNYDLLVENPFPILATPLTNLDSVHTAFDMNFLYPEISAEDARDEDQDTIHLLEDLSYHSNFNVTGNAASPNLEAELIYNSQSLGIVRVDFQNTLDNKRAWSFEYVPNRIRKAIANQPSEARIRRLIRGGKFLQIRYESGHTFSSGEFYLQCFRDLPFTGWQYENLDGYEVDREKPATYDRMGLDHSLFCWVWNKYSAGCWLYCDDRSGEVADFVKLQMDPGIPKISLIHVKAAHGNANRRFSVSAYEVVTAQAIKNLRHFEFDNFIGQISSEADAHFRYRIKRNGISPADNLEAGRFRDEFIGQLRTTGGNIGREIVVLQPHNRQSLIFGGKVNNNARCQLHTLLLSAEATCRDVGADFHVITDRS